MVTTEEVRAMDQGERDEMLARLLTETAERQQREDQARREQGGALDDLREENLARAQELRDQATLQQERVQEYEERLLTHRQELQAVRDEAADELRRLRTDMDLHQQRIADIGRNPGQQAPPVAPVAAAAPAPVYINQTPQVQPFKGTRAEDYRKFRTKITQHFELTNTNEASRCSAISAFLEDAAFRHWMNLPEGTKTDWTLLLQALDAKYEGQHNAEYARREFNEIRYKGIEKEAVPDYLTRLWHAAGRAWPAAGGAQNTYKRGDKVKDKLWDSMPADTRERLYVHFNGEKDTCDIDALARQCEILLTAGRERATEEQPYKYGGINELSEPTQSTQLPADDDVPDWVNQVLQTQEDMTYYIQELRQKMGTEEKEQPAQRNSARGGFNRGGFGRGGRGGRGAPNRGGGNADGGYTRGNSTTRGGAARGGGSNGEAGRGGRGNYGGAEGGRGRGAGPQRGRGQQRGGGNRPKRDMSQVECYECGELGHIARFCYNVTPGLGDPKDDVRERRIPSSTMPKDRIPRGGRGGGKTSQDRINELREELRDIEANIPTEESSENY